MRSLTMSDRSTKVISPHSFVIIKMYGLSVMIIWYQPQRLRMFWTVRGEFIEFLRKKSFSFTAFDLRFRYMLFYHKKVLEYEWIGCGHTNVIYIDDRPSSMSLHSFGHVHVTRLYQKSSFEQPCMFIHKHNTWLHTVSKMFLKNWDNLQRCWHNKLCSLLNSINKLHVYTWVNEFFFSVFVPPMKLSCWSDLSSHENSLMRVIGSNGQAFINGPKAQMRLW